MLAKYDWSFNALVFVTFLAIAIAFTRPWSNM